MSIITDITSFIFVEDKPQKVDIIFIPGSSWPEPSELAATYWHEGYAPLILPSGKYSSRRGFFPGSMVRPEIYNGKYETEWEFMTEVLRMQGVNLSAILCEDKAEDTNQNAFLSRQVTDSKALDIKKAIICCKGPHARRCLMHYQWAYPETEFFVCPIDVQNSKTTRDNWFKTSLGTELVMGELTRCGMELKAAIPTINDIR